MDHQIDYRWRLESSREISSFRPIHDGQAALCGCLEELDRLLLNEIGNRNIVVAYKTPTGNIADISLYLSTDLPLDEETFLSVHEYLGKSRRTILKYLSNIKSEDTFNELHKKLIKLEKYFDDYKFSLLIPTLSLNKKSLAKIIVKMSKITIGRENKPNLVYEDNHESIVFSCKEKIKMETLLGPARSDSEERTGNFSIRKAPGNSKTPFELMLDGRKIEHRIESEKFWNQWHNGEHTFVCFSSLVAKFIIENNHESIVYVITDVLEIRYPQHQGKQQKLF
jgi:hypothetical protein